MGLDLQHWIGYRDNEPPLGRDSVEPIFERSEAEEPTDGAVTAVKGRRDACSTFRFMGVVVPNDLQMLTVAWRLSRERDRVGTG